MVFQGSHWVKCRFPSLALGRRPFLSLLAAIGLALDGEDFGMMDQPVDQGDHATGAGEDFAPFREGFVGADQRALLLMSAVDEFEQQIGMPVRVGQIADLVDDEERRRGIAAQPLAQDGRAIQPGQVAQKLTG